MTTKELAEQLDMVTARAPKLREAGVIEIDIAGVLRARFAPAVAEPGEAVTEDQPPKDIWKDEVLFPNEQRKKG